MLKLVFLSAAVMGAAGAASAQSTDAPSWAGPYAGLHAGYGFDDGSQIANGGATANNITALTTGIRPTQLDQNRSGALGGGQIGYNFQRGNLIFGAEGDFSYLDSRGTTVVRGPQTLTAPAGRRTLVKSQLDWMGSARARLGYAVSERGMFYATGGYAFGQVKGRAEFDGDSDSVVNYAGSHKYTAQGWTAGGGLEFRPFTQGMMSKVSLGIETTYYDLGRSHIYALQTNTQPGYYTLGANTRGYNGVFKINYAF